jgi:hypothetical protein
MDLSKIPKHVWWIITPCLIIPTGFLIVMLGYLLYAYASILPQAKSITVETPNLRVITKLTNEQIAINEQTLNIISSTQQSIQKTISEFQKYPSANSSTINSINELQNKAILLKEQENQLKTLKNNLINFQSLIQTYVQKMGRYDDEKKIMPNLQK